MRKVNSSNAKRNQRARSLKSVVREIRGETAPPAGPPPTPYGAPKRLLTEMPSDARKTYPITTGVMDYFPDALAAVANVSFTGNQKHNPGQPLHWARGKSMDHADCIARHLQERGTRDPSGALHSAQLAWRALALLQEELEAEYGLSPPRGTVVPAVG